VKSTNTNPDHEGSTGYVWRDDWLALRAEPALSPEIPIIDPHVHFSDGGARMARYFPSDYRTEVEGVAHNVVGSVFVECAWRYKDGGPTRMRSLGETEAATATAETWLGRGIVGFVDLTLGARVDEVLEAHVSVAGDLFRGVRHSTAYDPNPEIPVSHSGAPAELMASEQFRDALRRLAKYGLTFDAWVYHRQLPEIAGLADAVPECTIVLDHFGGPLGVGRSSTSRASTIEQWRRDVSEVALRPNVAMKLGGIGISVFDSDHDTKPAPPSSDDLVGLWREPILFAIEQFGAGRCMFESAFPVGKVQSSYGTLWNAYKKAAAGASSSEMKALFFGTAVRVYGLRESL
jgi:L-fuconolactonase